MLYSQAHKCCVYDTEHAAQIASVLPGAKRIADGTVAVPCDLHNMQIMRHWGFEAVSPILRDYDWPIKLGWKPFNHQFHTSAFITLHPRCFVLNDIGTNKTLSTLWALDYLMQMGFVKKSLILSPLSTLNLVWINEIFSNFLSRRKCVVLYGDRKKRERLLKEDADFYIINHDGLGVGSERTNKGMALGELAATIRSDPDFNSVTVDEGAIYRDSGTVRYKILREVIRDKPYVQWLTGGPTPNDPTDAWAQARILRPDYKESQKNFRERTMYQITSFKWLPRAGSPETVAQILQPAIRFHRSQCQDLPPCQTVDRAVELSPAQKKAYDELRKNLRLQMDQGAITAINEASLRLKLIQIACGAVYDEKHEIHLVDASPRIKLLREVIESCDEKILIFAPLTSVVTLLYKELLPDYSVEMIYGGTSAAKRNEIFTSFQNTDKPRIIVADPGTMAHGLTLTAASCIVWYGPTDKPETYTQANGRINRTGQTIPTLVVRLTATAGERGIFNRLDGKETRQSLALDIIQGDD